MGLEHEELSGSVIGAAIEVHKALGPLFLESVFAKPTLEIKRVIASRRPYRDFLASWLPGFLASLEAPSALCEILLPGRRKTKLASWTSNSWSNSSPSVCANLRP